MMWLLKKKPSPTAYTFKEFVFSGRKMGDLCNEELLDILKEGDVTTQMYSLFQQELIKRIV